VGGRQARRLEPQARQQRVRLHQPLQGGRDHLRLHRPQGVGPVKKMRQDAKRRERVGGLFGTSAELETEASDSDAEGLAKWQRIEEIDNELVKHTALEGELKKLKANLREVEKKKDDMIAAARAKISEDEAKRLILERFQRLLTEQLDGYLRQYQRAFIAAVENLWQKYAVTTKQILADRDREATQLTSFLKELGYE
jgi:type I restriction enzyme M protein